MIPFCIPATFTVDEKELFIVCHALVTLYLCQEYTCKAGLIKFPNLLDQTPLQIFNKPYNFFAFKDKVHFYLHPNEVYKSHAKF